MSKLSKKPIIIPEKVKIEKNGLALKATGPLGTLSMNLEPKVTLEIKDNKLSVSAEGKQREERMIKGLTWSLIRNMIVGVKDGFHKDLEIVGVGFSGTLKENLLVLKLGLSHLVEYKIPEGIKITVGPKGTALSVQGIDKRLVGQTAAEIRFIKPPECYKGTGIKYVGEKIIKKAGKATVAVGVGGGGGKK